MPKIDKTAVVAVVVALYAVAILGAMFPQVAPDAVASKLKR